MTLFLEDGIITTVAGNGTAGYKGDGGPAASAMLNGPQFVAVDASGNVYLTDTSNNRIRMVTKSTGIITTVAGDGTSDNVGEGGLATSASLKYPRGVAVDALGNIYIADPGNGRIRLVTKSTGIITTVAGDGTSGYKGDGGPATSASFSYTAGIVVDASGNIYIADTYNHRIRMVTKSTGMVNTVAGDGTMGFRGEGGLATSASLYGPYGVAVDVSGNIYIADAQNYRIRLVTKSTGIITTVAGNGNSDPKETEDWRHQLVCITLIVLLSMHQEISTSLILYIIVFGKLQRALVSSLLWQVTEREVIKETEAQRNQLVSTTHMVSLSMRPEIST
jgi:trimeric autotransporter adhesin